MKVDVPVENFKEFLHHRAPMIWVDNVIEAGKNEKGIYGACNVFVQEDHLFLQENKKIRGSAAVEFVAQAYGFVRACYLIENNIATYSNKTLLTGIRSSHTFFGDREFAEDEELRIEIQTVRELHPLFFIRGEVFNSCKTEKYATVEIQLYIGE